MRTENVGKTSLLKAMRDALAWRKATSLARRFNLVASRKKAEQAAAASQRAAQLSGDTLSTGMTNFILSIGFA
jgi:prephenate dehydratase